MYPDQGDHTLPFNEPNHLRHLMFWWDRVHHMNVIHHQVHLLYPAASLLCQTSKHLAQILPPFRLQHLSFILRYTRNAALAVPFRVVQTVHFVHPVSAMDSLTYVTVKLMRSPRRSRGCTFFNYGILRTMQNLHRVQKTGDGKPANRNKPRRTHPRKNHSQIRLLATSFAQRGVRGRGE